MTDTEHPQLTSYNDLPSAGTATFQIGPELVTFATVDDGWEVRLAHPGYRGFLSARQSTMSTENGMEAVRDYGFVLGGTIAASAAVNPVTVGELKRFYFGDHADA